MDMGKVCFSEYIDNKIFIFVTIFGKFVRIGLFKNEKRAGTKFKLQ